MENQRPTHEQRVIDEQIQLEEKTLKLGMFFSNPIFETLSLVERKLLEAQHRHMIEYNDILKQRISLFK